MNVVAQFFRTRRALAVIVGLLIVVNAGIFLVAERSEMRGVVPEAIDDHAAAYAVALTTLYGSEKHFGVYSREIYDVLQQGGMTKNRDYLAELHAEYPRNLRDRELLQSALDAAVRAASEQGPASDDLRPMAATDIGLAFFATAAIAIFGPHVGAQFQMFFLIFLTSIALFVTTFRNDLTALVALAAAEVGVLSHVLWIANNPEMPDLLTLTNMRSLEILGIIPLLYIVIVLNKRWSAVNKWTKPVLLCQCTLVSLVSLTRSSFMWAVAVVVILALISDSLSDDSRQSTFGSKLARGLFGQSGGLVGALMLVLGLNDMAKLWIAEPRGITTFGPGPVLPWISVATPSVLLVCFGGILLMGFMIRRRGWKEYSPRPLAKWAAAGVFFPLTIVGVALPVSYFSDDVLPTHMRWHNPVIALSVFFEDRTAFPAEVEKEMGDTFAFHLGFLTYRSTVQDSTEAGGDDWTSSASALEYIGGRYGDFRTRFHDYYAQQAFMNVVREYPSEYGISVLKKVRNLTSLTVSAWLSNLMIVSLALLISASALGVGLFMRRGTTRTLVRRASALTGMFGALSVLAGLPLVWAYPSGHAFAAFQVLATALLLCAMVVLSAASGRRLRDTNLFASQ